MTTIQTITLQQVKRAAYLAYVQGRLQAQALALGDEGTPMYEVENYQGRLVPCAVGAAMTADTLKRIERAHAGTEPFSAIVKRGIVACDPAEVDEIDEIQEAHDAWCVASLTEREQAEQDFRQLLLIGTEEVQPL